MSISVKYLHSEMAGAPVLNNTPGSMIAVLDACLVNGWGAATVDSVAISGGVATVTRGAGHPMDVDSVAEISGATVSGGTINGQHKVLSVTASSYTFAAPSGVGDQTATGTITHKLAAAGWTKPYSGTNLAAYRMDSSVGLGHYLRVDDTDTRNVRVVGYGAMSGINSGDDPYPSDAQVTGGAYWVRTNIASDASFRYWTFHGDSRGFVLSVRYTVFSPLQALAWYFGEFASRKSPDPWASVLLASNGSLADQIPENAPSSHVGLQASSSWFSSWAPRGVSGTGTATALGRLSLQLVDPQGGIRSGQDVPQHVRYPNPADNGLLVGQILLSEGAPTPGLRGTLPGVYYVPQRIGGGVLPNRAAVTGIDALPGRRLRSIDLAGPTLIDVTGPWR